MHPKSYCRTCGEDHGRGDLEFDARFTGDHEPYDCDLCCLTKRYEADLEELEKKNDLLERSLGKTLEFIRGFGKYRNRMDEFFVDVELGSDVLEFVVNKLSERDLDYAWEAMSLYQPMSEEFMIKHIENIVTDQVSGYLEGGIDNNKHLSEDIKERVIHLKKVIDQG